LNYSSETIDGYSKLNTIRHCTATHLTLKAVGQKYISETKAAIILSTEAFWGMAFSVIILSEVMTTKMVIGAVLILVAIIISETKFGFLKRKKISLQ